MNYKHFIFSIAVIGFIGSCSSSKKTMASSNNIEEPSINLDTIRVLADELPKKKVYQATETKLNDIIHTKLWVSFRISGLHLVGLHKRSALIKTLKAHLLEL